MHRLPPLNALQTFEVVARHRSFTRAAEQLCITQGAVSRQIQSLEEYYGFALFTRLAKGLRLTVEGESLLPTVKECFARIEEVSRRLTRTRTDLALKVPTCVMRWIVPKIMRFQAECTDVQLQITTTWDHNVDFESEPFDAAIIYGQSPGADVHSIPLFEERLTPLCAPELLSTVPLSSASDLARHTLLHPTRDHRDWRMWLDYASVEGVDASLGQSFESLDLAVNAAAQGFGVAMGDAVLASEDLAARRLTTPFDIVMTTGQKYYFVYPDCVAHLEKVSRFTEWIADHKDD
jgi:LysR family glycine cleavage system transcriptional activator